MIACLCNKAYHEKCEQKEERDKVLIQFLSFRKDPALHHPNYLIITFIMTQTVVLIYIRSFIVLGITQTHTKYTASFKQLKNDLSTPRI